MKRQSETPQQFYAGEVVQVKAWDEIAKTLDENGTLDGLPFMPEMMEFCGQQCQVLRYAGKVCVEAPGGKFASRVLEDSDVVLLDDVRCSGLSHDGCQRSCMIFWKMAWLQRCHAEPSVVRVDQLGSEVLAGGRLKVKESPVKYFCQATQLMKITRDDRREDTIAQILRDLRTEAIGIFQMICLVVIPYFNKLRARYWGWPHMGGTLTRTPVEHLGLKPGDLVEVKSLREMQATLNAAGRNRGLQCDRGFAPFCERRYTVRSRLDRIISEDTGQMRVMDSTVTLQGAPCPCAFTVGGCTRYDFTYFREIWLRRAPGKEEAAKRGEKSLP